MTKITLLRGTSRLALSVATTIALASGAALANNGQSQSHSQSSANQGNAIPISASVNVTNKQLLNANKNDNNWLLYGRTYNNQRFSPLKQINASNVRHLTPAAIIQTGVKKTFEDNPIEVNGILYVVTAGDHVQAYNATNGKRLWTYQPHLNHSILCCGPEARGVAVAYGKVFLATLDGRVIALNAKNGTVEWKSRPERKSNQYAQKHYPEYYSFTMAPQVYDGKIIVGSSGAEWPTRDFVAALDAKTGKMDWKFYTTAAPGQPGGKTWSGNSYKIGGGSVWNTPAIDPKAGLVLFGVGNPNPDNWGKKRKGANAYTDSIVALHIKNGSLAWWFQEVRHDLWDYDADGPVVLLKAKNKHGKEVAAAAEAGKVGVLYIVNRHTGKLIRSTPFVKHSKTMGTVPSSKPVIIYPGAQGGNEWSPEAYSPKTHLLYVMGTNEAWIYTGRPSSQKSAHFVSTAGKGSATTGSGSTSSSGQNGPKTVGLKGQHLGGTMTPITSPHPKQKGAIPPSGNVSAINVNSGKLTWQYKAKLPMLGGLTATAGNLVFGGEQTGYFDAIDAKTGKRLWHFFLGAGVTAPPITYRVNGVQYVAVAAGGSKANGNPKIQKERDRPQFGDAVAIFRLPAHYTTR